MKDESSSLTVQLSLLLLMSFAAAALTFYCARFGGAPLLKAYLDGSDLQASYNERRVQSFRTYVEKNGLSATDTARITEWVGKHPLILLEIYRSNTLLYTSSAPEEAHDNEAEAPYYEWVSYYDVPFADGTAELVIYADDTYRFFTWLTVFALVLALLAFLLVFLRGCRQLVRYICLLSGEIEAMEGGDLDTPITIEGDHELTRLARSLDAMRVAFREQMEREADTFRSNQAMIAAMSHDLRTPLTALTIYTDILRYKKYEPEQLDDYLERIDAKAAQIRQLSEHIFEYSLVSGHQTIELEEPRLLRDVFHDRLSEMGAYLMQQGFSLEPELDWPDLYVAVNTQYIKRIVDNIASNLVKYAHSGYPIHISAEEWDHGTKISFVNMIRSVPPEQYGTHIGVNNMKAMMKKMGGTCETTQTRLLFRVSLWFPASGAPEKTTMNRIDQSNNEKEK